MRYQKKFHLIFLLFIQQSFGQIASYKDLAILIDGKKPLKLIGDKIYYLEDVQKNLEVKDVISPGYQNKFIKNNLSIFVRNAHNKTYWLRFTVVNQSEEDLIIEIGNALLWYLDYYVEDQGQVKLLAKTGVLRPEKSKMFPVNFFWFKLPKSSEPQTIYLRIQFEGTFDIPVLVGTKDQLYQKKALDDSFSGGYIGLVLVMLGFNLFLYFSIRDKLYLIYCCYLFLISFGIPYSNNNLYITHIFGEIFRPYWSIYFFIWSNMQQLFISLFAIRFLRLKTNAPYFYYVCILFAILLCALLPISNWFYILPFYINFILLQLFLLVYYLFLLFIGLYLWIVKKQAQPKYYVLAWVWAILSAFILMLTINGVLPYNYFTRNSLYFGFSLEILFFSLALGDRINIMRKEKEKMQEEHLRILEHQKDRLENEVQKRTKEILSQKDELQAQNEEIDQFNTHLEKLVEERTEKLRQRNGQLKEYAFFNSHKFRAPIARILGLQYLYNLSQDTEERDYIIQLIHQSISVLDEMVFESQAILDNSED